MQVGANNFRITKEPVDGILGLAFGRRVLGGNIQPRKGIVEQLVNDRVLEYNFFALYLNGEGVNKESFVDLSGFVLDHIKDREVGMNKIAWLR